MQVPVYNQATDDLAGWLVVYLYEPLEPVNLLLLSKIASQENF